MSVYTHQSIFSFSVALFIVSCIATKTDAMQLACKIRPIVKSRSHVTIAYRMLSKVEQQKRREECLKCINRAANCPCAQESFHAIVARGHLPTIELILNKCVKPEIWRHRNPRNGNFPIHDAKNLQTAQRLLELAPDLVNARNHACQTPLDTCPKSLLPLLQAYGALLHRKNKEEQP